MKSSPYENSPYTSDVPTEEFTQPLPPPPSLPAEGRESVLAPVSYTHLTLPTILRV